MRSESAVVAAALLLSIIIVATIAAAIVFSPRPKTGHSTTAVVSTSSTSVNTTQLKISLRFPDGQGFLGGKLLAGQLESKNASGKYVFNPIDPGNYTVTFSGTQSVYLPPTLVSVRPGLNYANLTIYNLRVFWLVETNGLEYNYSQPGPTIIVPNETAVRLVILNNSTLIHNLAVTDSLTNQSASAILFNSLSDTLTAGGTTNVTFIVTKSGTFYYADLIGSHAKDGEYGYFLVTDNIAIETTDSQRPVIRIHAFNLRIAAPFAGVGL